MTEEELYERLTERIPPQQVIAAAIEELSELSTELARYFNLKEKVEAIEEEIADVEIIVKHLRKIFDESAIDRWKKTKLEKLRKRI